EAAAEQVAGPLAQPPQHPSKDGHGARAVQSRPEAIDANSDADQPRTVRAGLLVTRKLLVADRGSGVEEDLLESFATQLCVGAQHAREKVAGGGPGQVKLVGARGVPRAVLAQEHHSVAGVQEHLCGAACRRAAVLGTAESKADIANSL